MTVEALRGGVAGEPAPAGPDSAAKPVDRPSSGAAPAGPRLFVVHAPEDAWFVDGFLLAALGLPDAEVLVSSKLESGAPIVQEIERGVSSAVTVVVVSPAFLASPWARFASELAAHVSVEAASDGGGTLIPAILADCELPLLSRFRVALDFRDRDRAHWEDEAARLRSRLAVPAPALAVLACPYPGMRAFTAEDAASFHGRDHEIRELLGRLRDGQRELYVIGPSGSGKSSLVAAGLVPALGRSPELAGGTFLVVPLRPGAEPLAALAAALAATPAARGEAATWLGDATGRLLASHAGRNRVLIFVDQLEELFAIATPEARAGFVAAVRALRGDARVALVLTLRADFYAALMESALWTDLDGRLARLDVGPLRGDQLRTAIEAPARALGVAFEPVLVERLLRDVADEPGALPLLQDTLLELWQHRTRGLLRLAEYEAMGDGGRTGLAVTLARRADDALNELSSGRREIARRVLLRLVQFGDGTALARRQQPRAALATAGDAPAEIDAVVRHLADRRLITTSGGDDTDPSARVDLAHEILLSAWPALAEWIRSRRQDEQRRRALEDRTSEWVKHGRGPSRLLDGDELREVSGWLTAEKARDLGVSDDIQRLVGASQAALAAQAAEAAARHRRWRRWVTAALAVLTGAVVAVSLLAVIAVRRSHDAGDQARAADASSREARRQASVAEDRSREVQHQLVRNYIAQGHALVMSERPAQAAPYLLAAREAGGDDVSLGLLFRWATQGIPRLRLAHPEPVTAMAWSPDGRRVATASEDGTARIWDAASGRLLTPLLVHRETIRALAWNPAGTRVATASNDGTARVWDAASGSAVTLSLPHADDRFVVAVAWSPDGTRLATGGADRSARVWDAASGHATMPPLAHDDTVRAVAWSPDGTQLATASHHGTARVWQIASGHALVLRGHQGPVGAVAWSPDGTRVATASEDGTARIWDAALGHAVVPPLVHRDEVRTAAWSPDGTRLATASADGTARVWDAATGQAVTPPLAHHGEVNAVAWSPDGWRVATASADGTARVWDAATGQPLTPPLAHRDAVTAVAWSPDGRQLATVSQRTVSLWQAGGYAVTPPLAHQKAVMTVAWRPDGQQLATGSSDATARIWDAVSGHETAALLAHQNTVRMVAWSPDGRRVATAGDEGTVRLWDAAGHVLQSLDLGAAVSAVAWSPDGTRIATAGQHVRVWDASNGAPRTPRFAHGSGVRAVAWSPDGKRLATGDENGTARVWRADDGEPVKPRLAHDSTVWAVAWSPDGTRLATASADATARVWDASSGHPVTLLTHPRGVRAIAWRPDGTWVATASDDGIVRVWDVVSAQQVTPALVHGGEVDAVVWSPDGRWLATASSDKTARVWDASSGQALTPALKHQDAVYAVAWRPDGRRLATASGDGTARVWDVLPDAGTIADWRATVGRGDYRLNTSGVLVARDPDDLALPPR